MLSKLTGIGGIIDIVGKIADSLHTSTEERDRMGLDVVRLEIEAYKAETERISGQLAIAKEEAKHSSVFVAGWRPAVGWLCVAGLGYSFLFHPLLLWFWATAQGLGWIPTGTTPPPPVSTEALFVLISGMLGLAGARTYERLKGVARN